MNETDEQVLITTEHLFVSFIRVRRMRVSQYENHLVTSSYSESFTKHLVSEGHADNKTPGKIVGMKIVGVNEC